MKLIDPVKITDAVMGASSLVENDTDDAPLWTTGAKVVGQLVRRPNHRVYECVVAHTATAAAADLPENSSSGTSRKWIFLRPTNLYAAFDGAKRTASVGTGGLMSWTLLPGVRFDSVALYGVDAASVRVRLTVAGIVKYDRTINLRLRNCKTWSEWFTKSISMRRDASFTDIPSYRNGVLEIIVSWPGNSPSVAEIQVGRFDSIGRMLWKPTVRTIDYSGPETDEQWGITEFREGQTVDVVSCDIFVKNDDLEEVFRLLRKAKRQPRGWLGSQRFGVLNLFGFAQDWTVVLTGEVGAHINLQIQELT